MFFNYLESTCFIKIFRYGRFDSVEYVSLGAEWQHARFIVCFNFSCCLLNKKLSIFSRHDTASKCLTTINSKTHLRLSKDWNISDGKFFFIWEDILNIDHSSLKAKASGWQDRSITEVILSTFRKRKKDKCDIYIKTFWIYITPTFVI